MPPQPNCSASSRESLGAQLGEAFASRANIEVVIAAAFGDIPVVVEDMPVAVGMGSRKMEEGLLPKALAVVVEVWVKEMG